MNLSTNLPQDARALACSEFLQHQNVSKLMQKLSQATDALLLQLWNESGLHQDAALLAAGINIIFASLVIATVMIGRKMLVRRGPIVK
jgi:hypothetical protein